MFKTVQKSHGPTVTCAGAMVAGLLTSAAHLVVILLAASSAHGADFSTLRGESVVTTTSTSGQIESCFIAERIPGGTYTKGDLKDEAALCKMNFYDRNAIAICPKLNSTNPGVDVHVAPKSGGKADDFERLECSKEDRSWKKAAKLKSSISCSYTPSIIGYYHLSRALGRAGRVPSSVLRTMDVVRHREIVDLGDKYTTSGVIDQTWDGWKKAYTRISQETDLFDSKGQLMFGALSENPRGEVKYSDLNSFKSYQTRYTDFKARPGFQRVADGRPADDYLPKGLEDRVQLVVQMADIADMVVMDTIMSQQDRIGNIHYKCRWYLYQGNVRVESYKADCEGDRSGAFWAVDDAGNKISAPDAQEIAKDRVKEKLPPLTYDRAVLVREMLLKDNDCGVTKSNMADQVGLLADLRHISSSTYQRVMALAAVSDGPGGAALWTRLARDWVLTPVDVKLLKGNLSRVATTLKKSCQAGALHLDLDVDEQAQGKAPRDSRPRC